MSRKYWWREGGENGVCLTPSLHDGVRGGLSCPARANNLGNLWDEEGGGDLGEGVEGGGGGREGRGGGTEVSHYTYSRPLPLVESGSRSDLDI